MLVFESFENQIWKNKKEEEEEWDCRQPDLIFCLFCFSDPLREERERGQKKIEKRERVGGHTSRHHRNRIWVCYLGCFFFCSVQLWHYVVMIFNFLNEQPICNMFTSLHTQAIVTNSRYANKSWPLDFWERERENHFWTPWKLLKLFTNFCISDCWLILFGGIDRLSSKESIRLEF